MAAGVVGEGSVVAVADAHRQVEGDVELHAKGGQADVGGDPRDGGGDELHRRVADLEDGEGEDEGGDDEEGEDKEAEKAAELASPPSAFQFMAGVGGRGKVAVVLAGDLHGSSRIGRVEWEVWRELIVVG